MGDTLEFILIALMWSFAILMFALPVIIGLVIAYSLVDFFSNKKNQEMYDDDVGVCEHCGDTRDWCRQC